MLKFVNRFTLSVMLILTLASPKTMGDVNLQPSGWACLDREHKEQVLVCILQNQECHNALAEIEKPPADWEWRIGAFIVGGLVGALIVERHR